MTPAVLKFGTDGWRAIIGDTYTFENVARVAAGTAAWLHDTADSEAPSVVLGHDTRFEGRAFAEHAARVLAGAGIKVILAKGFTATPAISWATKAYGCDAGVVLTASHNPPAWNGFKIKAATGGPAVPAQIAEVESRIPDTVTTPLASLDSEDIETRDVKADYLDMLRQAIDVEAIKEAGVTLVHDAMFGAGQGMSSAVLGPARVVELRSEINPSFRGTPPEPIERNLSDLPEAVLRHNAAAAVANDGDADRIGMVDDKGRFVDSHRLLALLLWYLHEERGLKGEVVKTFSTTDMLDRMAQEYGLTLHTTPIGFKYVCEYFLERDILVGGEESGGIAVHGHLPERDGIYVGLLILEMVVKSGRSLSELVDQLFERFGAHAYHRSDAHTSAEKKDAALALIKGQGGLKRIAGREVRSLEDLDGYKHRMDDAWLLVRPSGTEPVLRIYAEAPTAEDAKAIVADAIQQLGV